jgi:hypothetical protein
VGEFAVGSFAAYVVIGAAWALSGALWAPLLLATGLVAAAITAEIRFGAKATGFVVGVVPTAVVTAGLLAALVAVLNHLSA